MTAGLDPRALRVAFVGAGAVAQAFVEVFSRAGVEDIRAFARPRAGDLGERRRRAMESAGARVCASIAEATAGADVVIAAVPGTAAREVAGACVRALAPGCLYVDPAPLLPAEKRALSSMMGDAGARYVDVAILGTVAVEGALVPMLAAGDGAPGWAAVAGPLGFRVRQLEAPAGSASLIKLLRSVYMKGRDALVLEMVVAARRYDLEEAVLDSIGGPAERVPFPELATRVITSLAVHAERRAAELEAAAELLVAVDVEPLSTRANAARLRWMADLAIAAHVPGGRPEDREQVMRTIEALVPSPRDYGPPSS